MERNDKTHFGAPLPFIFSSRQGLVARTRRPKIHSHPRSSTVHMMKSALLVALFAVLAISVAANYSFSGNVTVSDPDGTLTFRTTAMNKLLTKKVVAFSSVAIEVSRNQSGTEINVDTLGGFISYTSVPGALLSYFTGSLNLNPDSFDASTGTSSHLSYSI